MPAEQYKPWYFLYFYILNYLGALFAAPNKMLLPATKSNPDMNIKNSLPILLASSLFILSTEEAAAQRNKQPVKKDSIATAPADTLLNPIPMNRAMRSE